MRNVKYSGIAAAAMAVMLFAAGCGPTAAPEAAATPTAAPTAAATAAPTTAPTATPTSAPELKAIGVKGTGETAVSVVLENSTGQDITGISVKDSSREEFPENMLKDAFVAAEKRELFYDTAKAMEAAASQSDDGRVLEPQYDVQVTLKDGTSYVLHAFPFGTVETCAVLVADGVAYIEYTSASGQKISTSGAERAILDAQSDAEYGDYQAEDDYTDYGVEDGGYEEPDYEEPQEPSYEEPDYEEPQEPSYEEPSYEEPSYEEPTGGSEDGCINDALFN